MDQVRRDTINEWNSADANVGPIPYLQSCEVLKDLARCLHGPDELMVRPPRAYRPPDRDAGRGRGGRDTDRRNDRRGRGGHGTVHFDTKDKGAPCRTDVITHLSCNCGGTDINSTYRQCLVSTRPSTTFFTALTLFDTGAYTSFVNRKVAKWLEQRQRADTLEAVFSAHSSKFDIPTASVGLAGTQLTSSIYGTVVFDLTLFNEVTQSDDILLSIVVSK